MFLKNGELKVALVPVRLVDHLLAFRVPSRLLVSECLLETHSALPGVGIRAIRRVRAVVW